MAELNIVRSYVPVKIPFRTLQYYMKFWKIWFVEIFTRIDRILDWQWQLCFLKLTASTGHGSTPVAKIFWGGVQDPKKWTFWTYPLAKTPFLAQYVVKTKSEPFDWLGCALHPCTPLPMGLHGSLRNFQRIVTSVLNRGENISGVKVVMYRGISRLIRGAVEEGPSLVVSIDTCTKYHFIMFVGELTSLCFV